MENECPNAHNETDHLQFFNKPQIRRESASPKTKPLSHKQPLHVPRDSEDEYGWYRRGYLLILSGLTLAGTVIALTIATPLFVTFSPVLVPAVIAAALLVTGFVASDGFGVAAVTVLPWFYSYVIGRQLLGVDQLDQARMKLASKAWEMKDRTEQLTGARAS